MPALPRALSFSGRRRQLHGLRVLVTGASAGVGRALGLALARRGSRVLATARRGERLTALAEEGAHDPSTPPLLVEPGDITDADFRGRLVATARERLGGLDIVIACAGVGAIGRVRDTAPATLAHILDVDFIAPVELVRGCLPLLTEGRDPAIVLVGSILGYHPLPLHGAYCAAKAALRSLAGTLRLELEPEGIDVVLASLGPTESEFWDSLVVGARPAWSRGRPLAATTAAAAILDGLERRRREIMPGWQARGFVWAARWMPAFLDAVCRAKIRSDREDPPGATP